MNEDEEVFVDTEVDEFTNDFTDEALAKSWNDDTDDSEDTPTTDTDPVEDTEADPLKADKQDAPPDDETPAAEETFSLKHLSEVKTVDKNEVIVLAQKGLDYDRIREERDKLKTASTENESAVSLIKELADQQGKTPQELIDETRAILLSRKEGITPEQAAERLKTQKAEKAKVVEPEVVAEKPAEKTPEVLAQEKTNADVLEFLDEYGVTFDIGTIPQEVWLAVSKGKSLLSAYQKWEIQSLKVSKATAEKAASNKSKSTGSRSSSGNSSHKMGALEADWYKD